MMRSQLLKWVSGVLRRVGNSGGNMSLFEVLVCASSRQGDFGGTGTEVVVFLRTTGPSSPKIIFSFTARACVGTRPHSYPGFLMARNSGLKGLPIYHRHFSLAQPGCWVMQSQGAALGANTTRSSEVHAPPHPQPCLASAAWLGTDPLYHQGFDRCLPAICRERQWTILMQTSANNPVLCRLHASYRMTMECNICSFCSFCAMCMATYKEHWNIGPLLSQVDI